MTSAGQVDPYSFVVTNTGNVTLHGITSLTRFTSPAGPVPSISCPATTLAPGGQHHLQRDLHDDAGRHRQRLGDRHRHGQRPGPANATSRRAVDRE